MTTVYVLTNNVHLYPITSCISVIVSSRASVVASVTRFQNVFGDGR